MKKALSQKQFNKKLLDGTLKKGDWCWYKMIYKGKAKPNISINPYD